MDEHVCEKPAPVSPPGPVPKTKARNVSVMDSMEDHHVYCHVLNGASHTIATGSREGLTTEGRSCYYDDGDAHTRRLCRPTMKPESMAKLRAFGEKLKHSSFEVRATFQDPKGNHLSVISFGHIHHPTNLWSGSKDNSAGSERLVPTVSRSSPAVAPMATGQFKGEGEVGTKGKGEVDTKGQIEPGKGKACLVSRSSPAVAPTATGQFKAKGKVGTKGKKGKVGTKGK